MMIILSTNSAKHFHFDNGKLSIGRFPDGEIRIQLDEDLKDKEVVVIGSMESPAENVMELLLLIAAVAKKGAKKILVLIPYFGYARSDDDQVVNSEVIVKMLEHVGAGRCSFLVLDPHSDNLAKYFTSPFRKMDLVQEQARQLPVDKDLCIVAPDSGSKEKASQFAQEIQARNVVVIEKERLNDSKVKIVSVSGNVTSSAVIVDDVISSGNTILEAAKVLKARGVKKIYVVVTHIIYVALGWKRLAKSNLIDKVYVTNSILPPKNLTNKFKVLDISRFLKAEIDS